jgi:hypothetical protein
VDPALRFAPLARLQPGETGETEGEGDTLPGLARQRDPFAVAGVRRRPLVVVAPSRAT